MSVREVCTVWAQLQRFHEVSLTFHAAIPYNLKAHVSISCAHHACAQREMQQEDYNHEAYLSAEQA